MNLVQDATMFPYKDAITGSGKGPFIDTGIQTIPEYGEFEGRRIYLSIDTVREMADIMKLTWNPEAVSDARTKGYVEGKLDATQEELGGNLARVAGDLGVVVDYLRARARDGVAAEDPEVPAV